jgi:hypothetical protein
MSSRFVFPTALDPHMRREELVTLSRTASQNAVPRINGKPVSLSPSAMPANSTTKGSQLPQPQRRHFVFADPVAFRHVIPNLHSFD